MRNIDPIVSWVMSVQGSRYRDETKIWKADYVTMDFLHLPLNRNVFCFFFQGQVIGLDHSLFSLNWGKWCSYDFNWSKKILISWIQGKTIDSKTTDSHNTIYIFSLQKGRHIYGKIILFVDILLWSLLYLPNPPKVKQNAPKAKL